MTSFGETVVDFGFLWFDFREGFGHGLRCCVSVRPAVRGEDLIRGGDDRRRFGGSDGQVASCGGGGGEPGGEDRRRPTGKRLQKLLCPL